MTLPIVDVAGVEYAHRCGYFAANGIESTIEVAASGPDAAQLVGTGEADVGVSAWHPLAPGWAAGAVPFVVAVDGAVLPPGAANIMVAPDSDIETINDLEGKTIAVNTTGALTEVALRAAFEAAGADFSTVTLVTVPIPEMVATLTAGSVDAMSAYEPITSVGMASGLKVIEPELLAGDFQNGSTGGFVALGPWAEANEETIRRARLAWVEVNEMFAADEAGLRAFIPVFTGIPAELAETMLLPVPRTTTEVANIQPSIDLAAQVGLVPETFDVTPFVAYPED
ncbi:MAG: ABC transporter substrate-binding protein [Acidimicrobiia bacterium]|nr:ABC transporter substrate-binding protein [Acidimicrobiia bacterium]